MHEHDSDEDRDETLRAHIRHLLLTYAVDHTATDYIELTEQAVIDLWCQYLTEIPTTDPHSLLLPKDPFDALTRIYALGSIAPLSEKFQVDPGAVQYIKSLTKKQSANVKPRSNQIAFEESSFESHAPICTPLSPILTRRAMRESPQLGSNAFLMSLPPSHPEFLASLAIKSLNVEPVSEPLMRQDEVLNTTVRLDSGEHDAVRSLLRSVLTARPKGYKNRYLDHGAHSPPLSSPVAEVPFIPIFPRRRRAGSGIREAHSLPSGVKGLPAIIPVPVKLEDLEPDLHEQSMVVVDGWHAYVSSPSPTPTPPSSQEDQLDELFMSSPDTTPPPACPAKMEIAQIPRTRRIGGARKPAPMGHETDLGSFLKPVAPKAQPILPPARPTSEPATSILGQPDSACGPPMGTDQDDLDVDVGHLYSHQKQDPRGLILREKVDENRQLLMEVPVLPPPTQHLLNALFLPSDLKDFVAPLRAKGEVNMKIPASKFLRKAKGIPSLNVELSWVPIAAKTRIPTNLEMMKVTALFDTDIPASDLPMQIAILQNQVPVNSSLSQLPRDTWSHRYTNTLFEAPIVNLYSEAAHCEMILSRKERRRAAGLPDEQEEEEESKMGASDCASNVEDVPARPSKRPRLMRNDHMDDSGVAVVNELHCGPISHGNADTDFLDAETEKLPPLHGDYDDGLINTSQSENFDPEQRIAFPADTQASRASRDDHNFASLYEQGEFEALSFDSQQAASAQPTQIPADHTSSDETYTGIREPHPNAIMNDLIIKSPQIAVRNAPDIATRSLGIAEFVKLRAKKFNIPDPEAPHTNPPSEHGLPEGPSHIIPDSVYDRNTLRLPSTWDFPASLHRYIVSMELLQKQGLVRSLQSRPCCIALVERDALGGVDVILDPHSAIIFTNLLILPSQCTALASQIAQQSWCYSRLLLIFEAYPVACSYQCKARSSTSDLFAYSPPVIKALGKLRRDIGISEGCGNKRSQCQVYYAFADTVDQAAMFTRQFGDLAEANDESWGSIWGDRAWLEDDIPEGEQDLAAADGMNRFAAFVILCQIDLGELLELTPEDRADKFGPLVGLERMVLLNQVIERRLQALEPSESEMEMDPPIVGTVQSIPSR